MSATGASTGASLTSMAVGIAATLLALSYLIDAPGISEGGRDISPEIGVWLALLGGLLCAAGCGLSSGLRRYSTLDRDALTALVLDPAWSNEGLFALLQGLRRLAETGGDRTDLPDIDWGN